MPAIKRSKEGMRGSNKRVKVTTIVRKPSLSTQVQRILNKRVERKEVVLTTASTPLAMTTAGTVQFINDIAEGSDFNQRIGRHIRMWNVDVDYSIILSAANSQDSGFVALVLDRQANSSGAAFSTIFDTSGGQTGGMAFKNTAAFDKRFKILWIDHYALSSGGPQIMKNRHYYQFNENGGDSDSEFPSSAAVVPNSNAVYLVYASAVANTCTIAFNTKLKWHDL